MSANAKIYEAREHCKAAERAAKTGMFRWKADYDSAADEYSQAAQCYRIARDMPNSKECHLKASECYKRNNAFFHAAKALENAIIVCKEIAPPEEIYNLAVESASLYQQHGSGDSGAGVLDKAAKILEDKDLELAVKLFQQAADVSSGENYEPSAMQINHLLNYIATPLTDRSRNLSTNQLNVWEALKDTLNDLWGPSKTVEEWIEILAELKIQEGFVGDRGTVAASNNWDVFNVPGVEQAQEIITAPEDEQEEEIIRFPEEEWAPDIMWVPEDEQAQEIVRVSVGEHVADFIRFPEDERVEEIIRYPENEQAQEIESVSMDEQAEQIMEVPEEEQVHNIIRAPEDDQSQDIIRAPDYDDSQEVNRTPNDYLAQVQDVLGTSNDYSAQVPEVIRDNVFQEVISISNDSVAQVVRGNPVDESQEVITISDDEEPQEVRAPQVQQPLVLLELPMSMLLRGESDEGVPRSPIDSDDEYDSPSIEIVHYYSAAARTSYQLFCMRNPWLPRHASTTLEQPHASIATEQPYASYALYSSEVPQASTSTEQSHASTTHASTASELAHDSTSSEQPQTSTSSEQPQASTSSEQPQASTCTSTATEQTHVSPSTKQPLASTSFTSALTEQLHTSEQPHASTSREQPQASTSNASTSTKRPHGSTSTKQSQASTSYASMFSKRRCVSNSAEQPQASTSSEQPQASTSTSTATEQTHVSPSTKQPLASTSFTSALTEQLHTSEQPHASTSREQPQASTSNASTSTKRPHGSTSTKQSQASTSYASMFSKRRCVSNSAEQPQASTSYASTSMKQPRASTSTEQPRASTSTEQPRASTSYASTSYASTSKEQPHASTSYAWAEEPHASTSYAWAEEPHASTSYAWAEEPHASTSYAWAEEPHASTSYASTSTKKPYASTSSEPQPSTSYASTSKDYRYTRVPPARPTQTATAVSESKMLDPTQKGMKKRHAELIQHDHNKQAKRMRKDKIKSTLEDIYKQLKTQALEESREEPRVPDKNIFWSDPDETESSQHQGSEYISKASRILVKLQRYDQAVDSLRREIGFHQESGNIGAIGRLTVAIVLVQLARGDTVAAEKAYKEWGSNCEVAEMQTLEQILQAYDEEDRESAKRALASPFIRNMDVEYARLAASVPLPEAMEPAPRATVVENAAPSYVSPNASSTTTAEISHMELEESPYAPVTYAKKADDDDGLC